MIGADYALRKIASHRVCREYGWDPEVVWGFFKGLSHMTCEKVGDKRIVKMDGKGSISTSTRAHKKREKLLAN